MPILIKCKEIVDFPDYLITSNGKIFRKSTKKEIKSFLNKSTKYLHVNLYNETKKPITKQIHRLVAIHFIENPENKKCVNHKDSNRLNNLVSNLEWNTHKENNQHAYDYGFKLASSLGIKRKDYLKKHR